MKQAFQITELSYTMKQQKILDNISLTVDQGTIYGFLGPNGAGKTTLMKMLLNLLHPDTGSIEVLNQSVNEKSYEYLRYIGSIIEIPVFYDKLTVVENLMLQAEYLGIYDQNKIEEKLKLVDLYAVKDKRAKELSLGMKQRLAIARALINEPELLILDEPINGLDPFGIKEIRELLLQINREFGTTIFISSHIISEIESLCDVIGFIDHGRLVKQMSLQEIAEESKKYIEIQVDQLEKTASLLDEELAITNFKVIDEQTIRVYDSHITQQHIMETLIHHQVQLFSIKEQTGDLEDYFLRLMNQGEKK